MGTYQIVRYHGSDAIDYGTDTDNLHEALVQCDARNVRDIPAGSDREWVVESRSHSADELRADIDAEDVEVLDVYDYLVDVLGLDAAQAERLCQ